MRYHVIMQVFQTFEQLEHYIFRFSLTHTVRWSRMTRYICKEVAAGAKLKKYMTWTRCV